MLIELVQRAAAEAPRRPVVMFGNAALTYLDCLERAERVAEGLRERQIERFGCALSSAADAVVALVAGSAIGSEACLYPPDSRGLEIARLASRFGHEVVVADSTDGVVDPKVVGIADLAASTRTRSKPPARCPVMILTTGTTGEQKGARHDWARLLKSVRRPDERAGTRWLLAYNLNQFAGIQMLLHVLASRGTLIEPVSRQAEDAIEAMRKHGVTHVSATPTFWRLLAGRLASSGVGDFSLQQITLGGEAAPESLIERLRTLFPSARISHVYAGTEFGSAVSVRDGRSGLPLSVLERGDDANVQLRIVDGELQVRSHVGMLGYHEAEPNADGWLPTGDIVEIRDGRIHFVGRRTEIINVGGAKVHPLPVEDLICSVKGVQLAAVYGRSNPVTGQIVAADVVANPDAEPALLELRIREACEALPPAGRPRRIRLVSELDMRGNKLRRHDAVTDQPIKDAQARPSRG